MENSEEKNTEMICPICGKKLADIHVYATHMMEHSNEEKKRKAEEEKQRKADQKKLDAARLEKLRKVYEDAANAYLAEKEKYEEKYDDKYYANDWFEAIRDTLNSNSWLLW